MIKIFLNPEGHQNPFIGSKVTASLLKGWIWPIGGVASALWADAFYKSKYPSLLRYRLNVFLPQLPEVGCPIFLEIQNPWGKVMERSGLRFEHFCLKVV